MLNPATAVPFRKSSVVVGTWRHWRWGFRKMLTVESNNRVFFLVPSNDRAMAQQMCDIFKAGLANYQGDAEHGGNPPKC